ncbi:MAG TPA: L-threonylcarbamoyladenylate synthase [Candidatus Udaeobacter sp.]|nr:L-threonylcarbamoyladenylate synthase [Candidatus Udaeobacter sp.]
MKTETVAVIGDRLGRSQAAATARAVQLLREGEVVALPTETVYGLAADALDPTAVAKIFEAKERPRFDPLILHLPGNDWLERVARIDTDSRALTKELSTEFWPGPLTLVLDRQSIVPEIVTAGLDTVAVRMSSHPVFTEVISAFGKPLAAPSANRFGRVSPTIAQHVFDELNGRVPLIIDAGPTAYGIESTIIAVRGNRIEILRLGPITPEQLAPFGHIHVDRAPEKVSAPGQLPSHYAPKTSLRLINNAESLALPASYRVGLLAWNPLIRGEHFAVVRTLSKRQDLREAASNLFRCLRELDDCGLDLIVAERVPAQGIGSAILDRLERASHDSEIRGTHE